MTSKRAINTLDFIFWAFLQRDKRGDMYSIIVRYLIKLFGRQAGSSVPPPGLAPILHKIFFLIQNYGGGGGGGGGGGDDGVRKKLLFQRESEWIRMSVGI